VRHRGAIPDALAPSLHPRKSVRGFLVSAAFTAVFAALFIGVFRVEIALAPLVALAVCLPFARQLGDLGMSAVKRSAGAEASGRVRLLPGHGGVLDRVDSLTVALPVALLVLQGSGCA